MRQLTAIMFTDLVGFTALMQEDEARAKATVLRHRDAVSMPDRALEVAPEAVRRGVLVLSGYGIQLRVERGHLIAHDGIGSKRRTLRLSRVQPKLKRVVVMGTAGTITLDALQWLHDTETEFVQIGYDGEVITTSTPKGRTNPELVRAQALVSASEDSVGLSRSLVLQKLEGQLAVLARVKGSEDMQSALEFEIDQLRNAQSGREVLSVEAQAAQRYWSAWQGIEVRFTDPSSVPGHWLTLGARKSSYTEGNRLAVTPANAILNYLYAVLQAETRLACFTMGLDPGIGLFHATTRWRDSLVFDLMEPARPEVDDFFLDLLGERTFESAEFFENRRGVVRVMPPLSHQLAETALRWKRVVGGIVEGVAHELIEIGGGGKRGALAREGGSTPDGRVVTTPLTQRLRRRGKLRPDSSRAQRVRRGWHQNQAWERTNPKESLPEISYEREILPGLSNLLAEDIRKATGLSLTYCAEIRKGRVIPHRRHWKPLEELGPKRH